jgi:hypothetical protein
MTRTKAERRPIVGAPRGWTISADGTPRKWGRTVLILKDFGGLPTIDVGGVKRLVDEVVAETFLGAPHSRHTVIMHFNGDDLDCSVTNIAWKRSEERDRSRTEAYVKWLMKPANRTSEGDWLNPPF